MTLTPEQRQAFTAATQLISAKRAEDIRKVRSWKNGMCLCLNGIQPTGEDATTEEDDAIKALLQTLPGSACWMDALHMLCHPQQYAEVTA